jgi:hypothetical protein
MEDAHYDSLLNDASVYRFDSQGSRHFLYEKTDCIINVKFVHKGIGGTYPSAPCIQVDTFPKKCLNPDVEFMVLSRSKFLVMVNSKSVEYAATYWISIDETAMSVTYKIQDPPKLGADLIRDDERSGVTVPLCGQS